MNSLVENIRHYIWLAIWIIPIPFGAFSTNRVGLVSLSLLLFLLLSIAVPVFVRQRQIKKSGKSAYAPIPFLLYGGFVGLFIGVGILNGLMALSLWQSFVGRLLGYTLWMFAFLGLQYVLAMGFAFWYERRRCSVYSEFIDPILYSLPLPCAVLGMFLFPAASAAEVSDQLLVGIAMIMSGCLYVFAVFVLAAFAFYFYPGQLAGTRRLIHCVRVFVMAFTWIFFNVLVFNVKTEMMGQLLFAVVPILQNNPLVFITPFIFEGLVIVMSVAVSNMFLLVFDRK
jgi:hypothetical protein